ncbi:LlaJI family restriction endonuclease [Intestinibacter sp.]
MEFELRKHCHVNTNEEGDRFVGIKVDTNTEGNFIYFPMGYDLPEDDIELRNDIRNLIQVLTEFSNKNDSLLSIKDYTKTKLVEFPINAYKEVIEYYFSIGGRYYIETEKIYATSTRGKVKWGRTIQRHLPLIQSQDGINSFIYTDYEVVKSTLNDTRLITQINKYCVYEAFKKIGWLYVSYIPEKPGAHPDIKTSIAVVQNKLAKTNDDKKKTLFQAMKDMLEYIDESESKKQAYFGTYNFEHVWEKMIDSAFGEKNKSEYFPRSKWLIGSKKDKINRPLMPDTIMIYDDKYYILDAKYYKYGRTNNPNHLPDGSSINKQITYGEYLEKYKKVNTDCLFNAFIMPYNRKENPFGLDSFVGNIGEAVGEWRDNKEYYERIQGIVMDVRHLMYNYSAKPKKEKEELAKCIENAFQSGIEVCDDNVYEYEMTEGLMEVAETAEKY